ncbi:MAG: hypothetical protein M1827_006644 [Pycnora praestabilis]|nr:MAG: hypothetical protein M1827_006644 [Pycnora praestabilis]
MADYDPEWLEVEKALGTRPVLSGTAEEITEQYNGLGAMLASQMPPPDPSVKARDEKIDENVKVRIYQPKEAANDEKLPVGVFIHGGGYITGSIDAEDPLCRLVAQHTPCIVVSVEYRLGPKHKLPVMIDDCVTAYNWAWNEAEKLQADQHKYFVWGGSAGGGLAFSVANKVIEAGKSNHIQGIVALTPVTLHPEYVPEEYKSMYTAYSDNAKDVPIIDAASMKTFYDAVDAKPEDPYTFTALSKNLKDFPPTYIATCDKDPLRDDGKVMEYALKKAGVKTNLDNYLGFPHYFWTFPSIKKGQTFVQNVVKGVHFVLGS